VHARERASGTIPLHWAAEGGPVGIVAAPLRRGGDLEARDDWFALTPLGWATAVEWAPRVSSGLVVQENADPSARRS
jgi:hypothetical protein